MVLIELIVSCFYHCIHLDIEFINRNRVVISCGKMIIDEELSSLEISNDYVVKFCL